MHGQITISPYCSFMYQTLRKYGIRRYSIVPIVVLMYYGEEVIINDVIMVIMLELRIR